MYVWQAVANMVKSQGVDFVFGLGDTPFQLFADKTPGLKAVNLRYEGSAPFMAMAYSRLSGKPGVCSGSRGPGITNMVSGVMEAYYRCTPLVVLGLSVSQKTEGMGEFQECDQLGLLRPITKWSARVPYAERIDWFMQRAFSIAMNGQPGPVFLEIPGDVGGDNHQYLKVTPQEFIPVKTIRSSGDPELINNAVTLLLNAKQPVVIAGNGVLLSNAQKEFREFVEWMGIPFLTTPCGRGVLSEDHPLALGGCGLYRTKAAKEIFAEADLVISIGSRNESFQTHGWQDFPVGAKFIQIDIHAFEIGRNWLPDVGIVGDARNVLEQLLTSLKTKGAGAAFMDNAWAQKAFQARQALEAEVDAECKVEETPIPAKRIVHELSQVFGGNTILVNENGSQDSWSYYFPYYKVQDDSECVPVAEQTCMGMGVVGAIAAKLTKPEKKVVCVTGDGAFQMYMKELPTAAEYKAGCTWVVLNNSALGWVKHHQLKAIGWDTCTFKVQPDFVQWAKACQCFGKKVEKISDIRPALEEALQVNSKGIPAVLDFTTGLDMSHFDRS